MGCGTSKTVDIQIKNASSGREPINSDHSQKISRERGHTSIPHDERIKREDTNSDNDKLNTYETNSRNLVDIQKESGNESLNSNGTTSPDPYGKTPGNMVLQERLRILAARRQSLQYEIGRQGDNALDPIYLNSETLRNGNLQPPSQDFPKRKSIFPPPPPRKDYSSPFGPRRRLSLTDSQKDFFRMLDEKVAQGKDYHSEDDASISSLVASSGGRKLSTILDALRSQHVR